jgi:hypothetical protein
MSRLHDSRGGSRNLGVGVGGTKKKDLRQAIKKQQTIMQGKFVEIYRELIRMAISRCQKFQSHSSYYLVFLVKNIACPK